MMHNKHLPPLAILLCLFFASWGKVTKELTVTPLPFSPSITAPAGSALRQSTTTAVGYPTAESSSTPFPTSLVDSTANASPSPTPTSMAVWKDDRNGFGIQYPADWQPGQTAQPGAVRYEGESGYFEFKGIFQGNTMDADRACTLEFFANPGGRYGAEPVKRVVGGHTERGSQIAACVIESKDRRVQSAQMRYVSIAPQYWYAVVETGGDRAEDVVFMDVPKASPPVVTLRPLPTTAPNHPNQTRFGSFAVKEWVISPSGNADDNMFFMGNFGEHSVALPTNEPSRSNKDWVKEVNTDLAPYGYRMEAVCGSGCTKPSYRFLRGSEVLKNDLAGFGRFSQSADKTKFVLGLWDRQYQEWLATESGLEIYDFSQHHYIFPLYAGQHLITLNDIWDIVVESDGQTVFRWPFSMMLANPEVETFFPFDGHWILEIQGVLIVDGEVWNITKFPADEIFEAHILDGKLFFFFRRNNQIRIYYNGQTFPTNYTLIHHYGCCGYAANNPRVGSNGIAFFAVKDGMWNYVEIKKGQ